MFGINLTFGKNVSYTQDKQGNHIYEVISNLLSPRKLLTDQAKLKAVLENPAALKVHIFLANVFSQVKFNEVTSNDVIQDFLYSVSKKPNPNQTWVELHWDLMFWLSLGNAYLYKLKDVVYVLNPVNIELTTNQVKNFQKITFSESNKKEVYKGSFRYKQANGDYIPLELQNLHIINDLSGGVSGDWFNGGSRLNALYQVVTNSDMALRSKGSNIEFTNKFFASGKYDGSVVTSGMSEPEKTSLENSLLGNKKVYATEYDMEVKQLVSNIAALKLDEAYIADLMIYGNMFDIPKDVIDIISKGSTYENQEKSIGRFIDYGIMPKAEQVANLYEVLYEKETIVASFKHLPFNSVFEKEKTENRKIALESLKLAQELGLDAETIKNKLNEIYN